MIIKRCQYGKYYIDYQLERADRKVLKLTVHPTTNIVVTAPFDADIAEVEDFIRRKWLWVQKQLRYFGRFRKKVYPKEYISGESYLYLGRQYKLQVVRGKCDGVKLLKGKLVITTMKGVRDSVHNKKVLNRWFRGRADVIFCERLNYVLNDFPRIQKPTLRIQHMNKRWGSYVTNQKIILNPLLIHASKDCIDYVITHELCHYTEKKHNENFYKLLKKKIPEWESVKEKLELRYT